VRTFEKFVDEAAGADVSGWDFDRLDGRATVDRPPWGYSLFPASRLAAATSVLDIDTGVAKSSLACPAFRPGWPLPKIGAERRPSSPGPQQAGAHGTLSVVSAARATGSSKRTPRTA
jgi:hypothetical protein